MIVLTDTISQVYIMISGILNSYLLSRRSSKIRCYAYLIGLSSQPFWFVTTIINKQYPMFILSLWYTVMFWLGVIQHKNEIKEILKYGVKNVRRYL